MTATFFTQRTLIRNSIAGFFSFRRILVNMLLSVLTVSIICHPGQAAATPYASEQLSAFAESRPGVELIMNEDQELYKFLLDAFSGAYTSVPLAWAAKSATAAGG